MSQLIYRVYSKMNQFVQETMRMKKDIKESKSNFIRSQISDVKLQSELLKRKSKQLES